MKTLVGTPDPPEPQRPNIPIIWSGTNSTDWIAWEYPFSMTVTSGT